MLDSSSYPISDEGNSCQNKIIQSNYTYDTLKKKE